MAQLHIDSLSKKNDQKAIYDALEKLPEGLDATYDEVIDRIWNQDVEALDLAKRVLMWISHAQTPLTVKQLQHAIIVTPGSTELDEMRLTHEKRLISVCAGIVTIDREGNIIRLVHFTAQEYFQRIRGKQFPDAQTSIATTCLTYLALDAFKDGPCKDQDSIQKRLKKYEFGCYVAQFWAFHARKAETSSGVQKATLVFLADEKKRNSLLQMKTYINSSWGDISFIEGQTLLHLVAGNGLAMICSLILEERLNAHETYLVTVAIDVN
jgi:hypothetical protein